MVRIPTTMAKDVLRGLGVERVHLQGVRPMFPQLGPAAGRARTLRFMPAREDLGESPAGPVNRVLIESLEQGEVMVVDAMESMSGSVLGDMLARRVKNRGATGLVTDGVIRDTAAMAEIGLAVFAAGVQPDPAATVGMVPWEMDVPVRCGGCLVMPGDWMLGDSDGVVVVPARLASDMVAGAERMLAVEEFSQKLLEAGLSLDEAFPLPAGRQSDLERYLRDGTMPPLPASATGG
jgi:regulator of RNase E activity RraA